MAATLVKLRLWVCATVHLWHTVPMAQLEQLVRDISDPGVLPAIDVGAHCPPLTQSVTRRLTQCWGSSTGVWHVLTQIFCLGYSMRAGYAPVRGTAPILRIMRTSLAESTDTLVQT